MNEINFGVRLDRARSNKLNRHLEETRLTKRAFMELTIDELRIAADSTCLTKSPKSRIDPADKPILINNRPHLMLGDSQFVRKTDVSFFGYPATGHVGLIGKKHFSIRDLVVFYRPIKKTKSPKMGRKK